MGRTKIIATIGPSSQSADCMRALIGAGMNGGRFNFSHGTQAQHLQGIQQLREIAAQAGRHVAVIQDLCGPKIRVGEIPEPGLPLASGQQIILTVDAAREGENRVMVSHRRLPKAVKPGDRILLADGMMELVVRRTDETDITCEVITGGTLTSHKGVNLPDGTLDVAALTPKDRDDLLFGLQCEVDYVALSFVRGPEDIQNIKQIITAHGKETPVIAKIEKHEALENMEAIVQAADGVMVARGDLGVEISLENVPGVQKEIIATGNRLGKPVIIATQMLRSMVADPRPTRAEATDVANGVLDGADAVMLSEESASGRYPVEAVQFMRRIIESAEAMYPHQKYLKSQSKKGVSESVAYSACVLAEQVQAAAIIAITRSGATAVNLARFRPSAKIIAFSPYDAVIRKLALVWGCIPHQAQITPQTDPMIESAASAALAAGYIRSGDLVVITAGRPSCSVDSTNMLWVKQVVS